MKEITLTRGYVTRVDDEDYEWLSQWKWHAVVTKQGMVYAARRTKDRGIYMHRLITDAPKGMHVDHIDRDSLNNSRSNLRVCTHTENLRNQGLSKSNTSGYRGLCLNKHKGKWLAQIKKDGHMYYLGYYDTPEEAAEAYDAAAPHYHGEFAVTNKDLARLNMAIGDPLPQREVESVARSISRYPAGDAR